MNVCVETGATRTVKNKEIGPRNDLSPVRRQTITCTNADS